MQRMVSYRIASSPLVLSLLVVGLVLSLLVKLVLSPLEELVLSLLVELVLLPPEEMALSLVV